VRTCSVTQTAVAGSRTPNHTLRRNELRSSGEFAVMLGDKMKPYTIFLFPICILLILTSSCSRTEQARGTTKVKGIENTENSRPEVLTEPGKYKKRLDLYPSRMKYRCHLPMI